MMDRQEQIESLERYTKAMAEAVRVNPYLLRHWSNDQTTWYLDEHYPCTNLRKWYIRQALEQIPLAGPVAYLLRGYGHGLDRSLDLITNQEVTTHLVKAHRLMCGENGIKISLQLFRDVVIDAAAEKYPQRNWMGV